MIRWILGFAIAILFAGFAAMNRQNVTLYFTPVHDPIEWPLFAIVLGFSALGFLIGAMVVWMNDGKLRREKRLQKRQIKKLKAELDKNDILLPNEAPKPDTALFPALTKQS